MHDSDDCGTRRNVLYVEDNEVNAELMAAIFASRPDLILRLASTCATALHSARAEPPDLLLLDLRLPDGHGATLLSHLRALPGLSAVSAIAVTAEDLADLGLRGFDDLWPKPLRVLQVLRALEAWLPRQHNPSQAARLLTDVPGGRLGRGPSAACTMG